jgi:hypothetical protein
MQRLPGVTITTSEALLFELMRSADHAQFRTVSGLLKEHNGLGHFIDAVTYEGHRQV